jgi:hypothetical protein
MNSWRGCQAGARTPDLAGQYQSVSLNERNRCMIGDVGWNRKSLTQKPTHYHLWI